MPEAVTGVLVYEDSFDYPDGDLPSQYWYEGNGRAEVLNNKLVIDSFELSGSSAGTVWLRLWLDGNFVIEFDAHVMEAVQAVNNINFFLLFSDPSGQSLYDSRSDREDGAYGRYHCSAKVAPRLCPTRELSGYILTYVAVQNSNIGRFRLRSTPGFSLLAEAYTYESEKGKTYNIEISKQDNSIYYSVDGEVRLAWEADPSNADSGAGYIGFRTWRTKLWIDNFRISRVGISDVLE